MKSSARSRLEGDSLTSATITPTEEEAAPSDASQNLLVGNAEEKDSDTQLSTDGCMRQNEGMNATHQNTVDTTSNLQSERSVGVATQGDHSEPLPVEEFTLSSTDGLEHINTEHRDHHINTSSAEEGEAATILNDDGSNEFGDFEDMDEGTLQSKGLRHVQSADMHYCRIIIPEDNLAWSVAILCLCACRRHRCP